VPTTPPDGATLTVALPKPLGLLRPTPPVPRPPMRVPENMVGRGAGAYLGGEIEGARFNADAAPPGRKFVRRA
jgi:hypothetical protein